MLVSKAYNIVKEVMESGLNCCEGMLTAAERVWPIRINEDVFAAASLFGMGMQSKCTCGALAGMVMASGILQKSYPHPLGKKIARQLHDRFKQEFGSTCCHVILKARPESQRFGRQACIELTAKASHILVEEWAGVISTSQDLR